MVVVSRFSPGDASSDSWFYASGTRRNCLQFVNQVNEMESAAVFRSEWYVLGRTVLAWDQREVR